MKRYTEQPEDAPQIVDCRPPQMYNSGHLPGAINVPYPTMLNPDKTLKSGDELANVYTAAGVKLDRETVMMCQIGVASSAALATFQQVSDAKVSNYDGSWAEFSSRIKESN